MIHFKYMQNTDISITHSKKYHKYITNIPQIYHKSTTKCDIVPQNVIMYHKM